MYSFPNTGYLTDSLLTGTGNRSQTVGGILSTTNCCSNNQSAIWTMTAIAGLQLTNSVGLNDFVKAETYLNGGGQIYHNITASNNNLVKFVCTSSVFVDPSVHEYYHKTVMEFKTLTLTGTNEGLSSIIYEQKYDGNSRMFFGFSQFNLTMSDTRYLNIETSNISLVSKYFRTNAAMNEVIIEMLFFAFQTCIDTTMYYDPQTSSCLTPCPVNSIPNVANLTESQVYKLCKPCDHTCLTCAQGQSNTHCNSCPPDSFRTGGGGMCPCDAGYADIGVATCIRCDELMPGCVACTSSTICTDCNNITYAINVTSQQCGCLPGFYSASSYCLTYSGCLEAIQFNNTLACTTCDTSLNYIRVLSNESCACNEGFFLNTTAPNCYDVCGDSITAMGHCDDGNTAYGDGCD